MPPGKKQDSEWIATSQALKCWFLIAENVDNDIHTNHTVLFSILLKLNLKFNLNFSSPGLTTTMCITQEHRHCSQVLGKHQSLHSEFSLFLCSSPNCLSSFREISTGLLACFNFQPTPKMCAVITCTACFQLSSHWGSGPGDPLDSLLLTALASLHSAFALPLSFPRWCLLDPPLAFFSE